MTTYKAANRTKHTGINQDKIGAGMQGGKKKVVYDSFALSAALTTSDKVEIFELPAGARILNFTLNGPTMGGTGTFNVGWEASASGDITADANGLLAAADHSSGAAITESKDTADIAGLYKYFDEPVLIVLVPAADTTATSGTLDFELEYIID